MKRSLAAQRPATPIKWSSIAFGEVTTRLLSPAPIKTCKVDGCDVVPLAKGLCQKHYGRARRKQPLDVEPRRGLVQLVIHVDPGLKRWLKKTARRDKVSVSQRASTLLQSEMDNLNGKNPF